MVIRITAFYTQSWLRPFITNEAPTPPNRKVFRLSLLTRTSLFTLDNLSPGNPLNTYLLLQKAKDRMPVKAMFYTFKYLHTQMIVMQVSMRKAEYKQEVVLNTLERALKVVTNTAPTTNPPMLQAIYIMHCTPRLFVEAGSLAAKYTSHMIPNSRIDNMFSKAQAVMSN